jgi:hypothetical protein
LIKDFAKEFSTRVEMKRWFPSRGFREESVLVEESYVLYLVDGFEVNTLQRYQQLNESTKLA